MWIRGLIAVACLVVIAAGGLWIWQQVGPKPATRDECLTALRQWVTEDKGPDFDGYLSSCRDNGLINLSDING